jgi:two-component system response regulator FlrC
MRRVVLIVDDDPDYRATLVDLLELEGHSVVSASNGAEATRIIERDAPALVITDLRMPVMDGAALLKWVQAHPAFNRTPVVVVSAEPDRAKVSVSQGAVSFLRKPFRLAALLQLTDSLLHPSSKPAASKASDGRLLALEHPKRARSREIPA